MERTIVLEFDPDAGELNGETSQEGYEEATTEIQITKKEFGRCLVTGKLIGVHYATLHREPTALIHFRFSFGFRGRPLFRYKSAQIKVIFARASQEQKVQQKPQVQPMIWTRIPRTVYGESIQERVTWKIGVSSSIKIGPPLPVQFDVTPTIAREASFVRGRRMEIHAHTYADQKTGPCNVVIWNINENPLRKDGIPHYFSCAVLVKHNNHPFQAEIELKLSAGIKIVTDPRSWGIVGRPWTKDDPLLFNDTTATPSVRDPRQRDFSEFSDDDWRRLVELPEKHEVMMSCLLC